MIMAESRRRAGLLHETMLHLLRDQPGPLSGVQLARMMRETGHPVPPSLIFRAVRQLTERGAVRKIEVAKGYVLADGPAPVSLFCRTCGASTELESAETLDALRRAASVAGFTPARYIVEVPGVCDRCAAGAAL
jgi:Fur family zinc uptake transcriptional regulator